MNGVMIIQIKQIVTVFFRRTMVNSLFLKFDFDFRPIFDPYIGCPYIDFLFKFDIRNLSISFSLRYLTLKALASEIYHFILKLFLMFVIR